MFSISLNEAVRRGVWTCVSSSTLLPAWFSSSSRPLAARTHQRRHSSSKPSSSPKDESIAISTPSAAPSKEAPVKERADHRRVSRRKSKDVAQEARRSKGLDMPSVPSTQNLKSQDIHIASFFSIHRPISVTSSFPQSTTPTAFSKIFAPSIYRKPQPAEVIYTISSAVELFENPTSHPHPQQQNAEDNDLHGVITSSVDRELSQPQTLHINIEELATHFRPFVPPPAPAAEGPPTRKRSQKTKQKSYSTVVTIVERTHPDGQISYKRLTSPFREDSVEESLQPWLEEENDPRTSHVPPSASPSHNRQPFLNRLRNRQIEWERTHNWGGLSPRANEDIAVWKAISVRRQRKLKMKKHKYKKLMKRTRNLRRKLDRV